MGPNVPDELRLTLRRLLIVVASFAAAVALLAPALRALGRAGFVDPPAAFLVLAPWILGTFLLALDRRGPVKYWAAPLLLSLIAPALVLGHDWLAFRGWLLRGTLPAVVPTFALNLVLIGAFSAYLADMCPRRCPRCGRWTLIPLLGFLGRGARTPNTRWCGACGAKVWRRHRGEDWKMERRRTWIDDQAAGEEGSRSGGAAPPEGRAIPRPRAMAPAPPHKDRSSP